MILKLHTRLFQKAGFYPLTATNGLDGLNHIREEKPLDAVIDNMVSTLTGIEVCNKVCADETCREIKLILFTADKRPETRTRALNAGADAAVLKSPDTKKR